MSATVDQTSDDQESAITTPTTKRLYILPLNICSCAKKTKFTVFCQGKMNKETICYIRLLNPVIDNVFNYVVADLQIILEYTSILRSCLDHFAFWFFGFLEENFQHLKY